MSEQRYIVAILNKGFEHHTLRTGSFAAAETHYNNLQTTPSITPTEPLTIRMYDKEAFVLVHQTTRNP